MIDIATNTRVEAASCRAFSHSRSDEQSGLVRTLILYNNRKVYSVLTAVGMSLHPPNMFSLNLPYMNVLF